MSKDTITTAKMLDSLTVRHHDDGIHIHIEDGAYGWWTTRARLDRAVKKMGGRDAIAGRGEDAESDAYTRFCDLCKPVADDIAGGLADDTGLLHTI